MDICKQILLLPDDIKLIIKEYIPFIVIIFLERKIYLSSHPYIEFHLRSSINNYFRFVVRNDLDFVFEQVLINNYQKWLYIKKYKYKETSYYNYFSFILSFIIENNSNKCGNIANLFIKKNGISKKSYKNNTFINKRWKI
jgi:hypothetical protein